MIESPHNETYRKFLSLTTSKGLKEEGLFLLSGEKLIREFLAQPHLEIEAEVIGPGLAPVTGGTKTVMISGALFKELDVLGTHFNILVLKQPVLPILADVDVKTYHPKGIEMVVPLGDPGNMGALIRSAEAFAVPRVILTREAAHPFLPKAVKASAGSVLRVSLVRGPSLAAFPAACVALDMEGTSLDEFIWPADGFLVVGEEGPGFSAARFSTRVRIPTTGVESLNVVVAASIALSRLALSQKR